MKRDYIQLLRISGDPIADHKLLYGQGKIDAMISQRADHRRGIRRGFHEGVEHDTQQRPVAYSDTCRGW